MIRSIYFIVLFIICSFCCHAQKRLYYGFNLGTSYAITTRFSEFQQFPGAKYKTQLQPIIGFMMEYWFNENVGAHINLNRLQLYGDSYKLESMLADQMYDSIQDITSTRYLTITDGGIGLNKNYYDISLQFRQPIKQTRFYVKQAVGLVIVPNIKQYWFIPYEEKGHDYPLLRYRSSLSRRVSNRFNYGFSANLGLDYKFGKIYDRFFYLNLDYTKCFVENERWEMQYIINNQSYKAGSKSYGDYFSAQIGYKAPWSTLRSKKKREELKKQNK